MMSTNPNPESTVGNSSVDLLEYVAKLLLYDDILKHITIVAFGPLIHDDEKIVQTLKKVLPDFELCINTSGHGNLANSNLKMVHKIVNQHFADSISISKLHRAHEKRLCFEAAFLLLFSNREEADDSKIRTIPAFLQKYPEFKDDATIELSEQEKLLKFRNMMKLAQLFIPVKNHKEHLMDLVTRLVEGKDQKYVTGSGEKPATRRRVLIYEREGEIRPIPRPPRAISAVVSVNTVSNVNATFNDDDVSSFTNSKKRKDIELKSSASVDIDEIEDEKWDEAENLGREGGSSSERTFSSTVSAIPMAPKLHHLHGRMKVKMVTQPQTRHTYFPSSYFQEISALNHIKKEPYQLQASQPLSLSSLLQQHKDETFIEENLNLEVKQST